MKKIEQLHKISGGDLNHAQTAFLGFCFGCAVYPLLVQGAFFKNIEQSEKDKLYEAGFSSGYDAGRSDGLTIAATGKLL